MPYRPSDAPRHNKKLRSAKAKRGWSKAFNKTLRDSGDEGKAFRIANYVGDRAQRSNKRKATRSRRK